MLFLVRYEPLYERVNISYLGKIKSAKVLLMLSGVHEDFCELKCFRSFMLCNAYFYDTEEMLCRLYQYSSHLNTIFDENFDQFIIDYNKTKNNEENSVYFMQYTGKLIQFEKINTNKTTYT